MLPRLSRRLLLAAGVALSAASLSPGAEAQEVVEKRVFELPSYTTRNGTELKQVRVGWQSMGTLNADRSNAILVAHFFSGNSHFAGRYTPQDAAPGYWDMIIGPGKAIDTNRYYVLSVDSLINLNTGDGRTVTTGPASINPATGKPYGADFPVVSIRDFVDVQKAVVESLGITRLHAVAGASMGALQALEWAVSHPQMVSRVMPVIGTGQMDGWTMAWLNLWAAPILVDPNWNGGNYHGGAAPMRGLTEALKLVTLHARSSGWVEQVASNRPAQGQNPGQALAQKFQIESLLDTAAAARARISDAAHFVYLVRANQLFLSEYPSPEAAYARATARFLILPAASDVLFPPAASQALRDLLVRQGRTVEYAEIPGVGGHVDGIAPPILQVADRIKAFIDR
ncbi:MAG: homoserine O-acetyltransferase [Alphaproteobacteria bacterium]|nr:MAG: homoserine O-acetyltransferase [Alphaproteobacteria bacterium]